MKTIEAQRRIVDVKQIKKCSALTTDTSTLISEPCVIMEGGAPIIVYGSLEQDTTEILRSCKTIGYIHGTRDNGLTTHSRTFGALPRFPLRNDVTSYSTIGFEHPRENSTLFTCGKHLESIYKNEFPDAFAKHQEMAGQILPEYKIADTVFTSGVVNNTSSLKYHHDAGNFDGVKSCMLILKKDIDGGHLSFPEFDFRLDLKNNAFVIFDGQEILHGVTKIRRTRPNGYRYSIVYYSLKKLLKAKTADQELEEARNRAKAKAMRRAGL